MRFLQIVVSKGGRSGPPDPEHLAKVRKAMEDDIASGRLVALGALGKRATSAARVAARGGEVAVEDPPAGDDWMTGGGYRLLDVSTKEEAIARAKATLEVMGDGVVELIQVTEMYPPPRTPAGPRFAAEGPANVSVRRATPDDVQFLAELNLHVQELHGAHRPHFFKDVPLAAVADWFRAMLQSSDNQAWIAEVDGIHAGYALSIIHQREETPFCAARRFCEIDRIGVSPAFRKRGVARALVERVLTEARLRGIDDVELSSWSFNVEAHRAFQALGFVPKVVRFERVKR